MAFVLMREKNPPTALGLDELKGIHVVDTRLIRRRQEEEEASRYIREKALQEIFKICGVLKEENKD